MDYTQPEPPAGPEPPGSGPPQAPPQPPAGGPPQQQAPYQYAGGYPSQAPPPPPAKKGFNWLACCGITCAVLLIVGGLVGFCSYRMFKPFITMGVQLEKVFTDVQGTDIQSIKSAALAVDPDTLTNDPEIYKNQWLELSGTIDSANSFSGTGFPSGAAGSHPSTNYTLKGGLLLMDVTNSPAVGGPGDDIVAYGKIYSWDFKELGKTPFIGKAFVEEMEKEPDLKGQTQFIFFVAKEVSLAPPPPSETDESAPADTDTGWE